MSKLAELLYGEPNEVAYYLDATFCTPDELRAALQNAFRRIAYLEKSIAAIAAQGEQG